MKAFLAVLLGVSASASGWAQGRQQDDRGAERRVQQLKQWLNLTDDQVNKAREIYKTDRDAQQKLDDERQKLDKDRQDKIRDILTDDQKKTFDDGQGRGGRGGRGNRGQGGNNGPGGNNGWMTRFLAPTIDDLKKELDLNDDQTAKIKEILDEYNKKAQEHMDELTQKGFQGVNWQEEMDNFRKGQEELGKKIKERLTDAQKEKYDQYMQRRNNPFGGGRGRGGQNARELTVEERVKNAMDALKIEKADEANVIQESVKKVVEAQHALEQFERDSKASLDELAKNKDLAENDVQSKLTEIRAGRKDKERAIRASQKELAEIVTDRQEFELVRQNILR